METALDLSRWTEKPRGVGYRRWVIMSAGLRQVLAIRFFKAVILVAWLPALAIAAVSYLSAQAVTPGSWIYQLAADGGPKQMLATLKALTGFVTLYPDVCIGGSYTVLFWAHSFFGLGLCLVALTVVVPQLITRDRASQALIIYLSRPLTSTDYLLGKFGIIVGLLLMLWTGPLLTGWLLGMMLSGDSDFLVYSLPPLLRALEFNAIALVVLAPLALGVSALTRNSRATMALWVALWLLVGTLAQIPDAPNWLRHASFSYNLNQVRLEVLPVTDAFADAAEQLPLLDPSTKRDFARAAERTRSEHFPGAVIGLGVIVALASSVFLRRLRVE